MSDKLCIRKSDDTLWEPSYPDHRNDGHALALLFSGDVMKWYFRAVEWEPSPWWKFWTKGSWQRTGEIWEPESGEFDVVDRKYAPAEQEPGEDD